MSDAINLNSFLHLLQEYSLRQMYILHYLKKCKNQHCIMKKNIYPVICAFQIYFYILFIICLSSYVWRSTVYICKQYTFVHSINLNTNIFPYNFYYFFHIQLYLESFDFSGKKSFLIKFIKKNIKLLIFENMWLFQFFLFLCICERTIYVLAVAKTVTSYIYIYIYINLY